MRIIFLDIDGVMNSTASAKQFRTFHRASPEAVTALNCILRNDDDIQLVISSAWRELHSLDYIAGWLEGNGVQRGRVLDKTPVIKTMSGPLYVSVDRGDEITKWIAQHDNELTSYVVLDDDYDMADHKERFIRTDFSVGLTMGNARSAVKILETPRLIPLAK